MIENLTLKELEAAEELVNELMNCITKSALNILTVEACSMIAVQVCGVSLGTLAAIRSYSDSKSKQMRQEAMESFDAGFKGAFLSRKAERTVQ